MTDEVWTVRKVLGWTAGHFEKSTVDSPRLTAEILLTHVLNTSRVKLYTDLDRPLQKTELAAYRALITKRLEGQPTAYLTGYREFYGRRFAVDARVLVPRPETELLVEAALKVLPKDAPSRALDLCTGSGCVALSLALERPKASVWAVDVSPGACAVAKANAEALGAGGRVTVLEGDLFAPVPEGARFDLVTANAPYVKTGELAGLQKEVRQEPTLALDGGPDGLDVIRRIADGALARLKPGGLLALEIGDDQGEAMVTLLTRAGYRDVRVDVDLARLPRLAFGTAPGAP
ncbi:MAG: peptide chain release factor N(5)-glutamine methyltransferase [Myxococcaceae bacterium]|nr:peptide chain release factor N(5)-glutamine methyltransferase [Myxococcaceae bacterium]